MGALVLAFRGLIPAPWGYLVAAVLLLQGLSSWGVLFFRRRAVEARLQELQKKRTDFLGRIRHEFRTPMNGIIGMSHLLLNTELSPQQKDYVLTSEASAESLLVLFNDIVDYTKAEEGVLELRKIPFNLRHTLQEVSRLMDLRAQNQGLEYHLTIDPEVPSLIMGDPGRVRQVLLNLIGNALKFTREGSVDIHIRTGREKSDASAEIVFEIQDTGVGIPRENQEEIFHVFNAAGSSQRRTYGGSGLGLSISRRLARMMGGDITVASREGEGSLFTFRAPFDLQREDRTLSSSLPLGESRLQGKRILLADRDESQLRWMAALMDSWGCSFDVAATSDDVMARLEAYRQRGEPFDAALIDGALEPLSGTELGALLAQDAHYSSVKLILAAAVGRPGDGEMARNSGYSGYLVKPLAETSLKAALEMVMAPAEAASPEGDSLVTRHTVKEEALKDFRILIVEDNETNLLLARKLVERAGFTLDTAENGLNALEQMRSREYGLVLMDMQLPEMDGYEATRRIRRGEAGGTQREIPVIALTANTSDEDRREGYDAGIDDYLAKPVDSQKLYEILSYYAARYQNSRLMAHQGGPREGKAGADEEGSQGPRPWNREDLLRRVMGDESIINPMLEAFMADAPHRIEVICQAWESRDWALLKEESHSLKGLAATVGLEEVQVTAKEINDYLKETLGPPPQALRVRLKRDWERAMKALEEAE